MRAAHLLDHPCDPSGERKPIRQGEARHRAVAVPRGVRLRMRTGMEPFLAASAAGLCLWALLLAPFLL